MNRRVVQAGIVAASLLPMGVAVTAESAGGGLRWNPFEKPQLLAEPPEAATPKAAVPPVPPALTGTLVSATAPMAIVDGRVLGLGEEHQGYRLVSVHEGWAEFVRSGETVRLAIAGPRGGTE